MKEELFNQPKSTKIGKDVLEHMKQCDVAVMIDKEDYLYVNDIFKNGINYQGQLINII